MNNGKNKGEPKVPPNPYKATLILAKDDKSMNSNQVYQNKNKIPASISTTKISYSEE